MNRVMLLFVLFFIVGCSGDDANEAANANPEGAEVEDVDAENGDIDNEEPKEPVTIQIALPFGEDLFAERYGTVQEIIPDHIELEWVYFDGTETGLEELFASGIMPDIFNTGNVDMMYDYGILEPLDELIESHGFDTSFIHDSLIAHLRSLSEDQQLVGFPDGASYMGLYYNKEVFDVFGVDYPDPNNPMTWDEAFELARQLTGERNGVEYIGLEFPQASAMFHCCSLPQTPPTNQVRF